MANCRTLLYAILVLLTGCSQKAATYQSFCDQDEEYHMVDMRYLLRNIGAYEGKYVEVEGKYKTHFEQSALFMKSSYNENYLEDALWVEFDDFTIRCPLISSQTRVDLFGKGQNFRGMDDRILILHGRIDTKSKGHLSQYIGSIKDITLVSIY